MTGYGIAAAPCLGGKVAVEIRTVNHKYCDVKARLPRDFLPLESRLVNLVRAQVARGHVELSVRWEEIPPGRSAVRIDLPLARSYAEAYNRLREDLGLLDDVDLALLAGHDVVTAEESPGAPEELWPGLAAATEAALGACLAMRASEGSTLAADLKKRAERLEDLRSAAAKVAPRALAETQNRFRERIAELAQGVAVDPGRLAQELAFLCERCDVSEELKRIESHLFQMREALETGEAVGRKLDFLCQELLREINTIGSKSQNVELTQLVVEFKVELEKLREQVQNVE
jgi:uncharacterized protein (TIGR00255 family)